jgi:predicted Fe-Mo cluster-binding NifX family protein
MKIAVVTDDMKTISAHFGRAQHYLVFTMENGIITAQEARFKAHHSHFVSQQHSHEHAEPHGSDPQSEVKHASMMETIIDCDVLLAGGMGRSAYDDLKLRSIQPVITDIQDAQEAVEAYLAGEIIDHPERLH